MTLRFKNGKPVGLDWTVCNDGKNDSLIWKTAHVVQAKAKPPRPGIKNPGVGRGGSTRVPESVAEKMIHLYKTTDESPKQIAKRFGYTRQAMYAILRRYEIPTRTRSQAMTLVRATTKW